MKKVLSVLVSLLMAGSMTSCAIPSENSGGNGGGSTNSPVERVYADLEKDYVYVWNYDGLNGRDRRMSMQSENYSLFVDAKSGKLIGAEPANPSGKYVEKDFSKLPAVDMSFFLKIDGNYVESQDLSSAMRIIDSGRYLNRVDNINIRFPNQGTNKYGRIEYVATKTHVALNYGLYSTEAGAFDLAFDLTMNGTNVSQIENGRGVKAIDAKGNGFAFLKQEATSSVEISVDGSKITFSKDGVQVQEKTFANFGVIMLPIYGGSMAVVEEFLAIEGLRVTATAKNGENLPVYFKSSDGAWTVDINSIMVPAQNVSSGRNALERAEFKIENNSNIAVNPIVAFNKTASFSITGMSPMLRNVETLEPTGEQVQISKNWHRYDDKNTTSKYFAPLGDAKRYLEGSWYHGYTSINVQPSQIEEREYTCAYGNWGGVYSASHAQLCLIGWGGNQVWDQSALGSWGESVTYDPDICLDRAIINDVRPFLVKAPTGNNQEYDWSGNVGGAEFLSYIENGEQRIVNQKITYRQQSPNMTDVIYSGVTANGKIATEIKINLGRTDDIVRNYYTIKYKFLEDVTFGRLSLFKVGADGYADNSFTKFAYGTENGAIAFDRNAHSVEVGFENGTTKDATGNEFWYTLYNSTNADENGDVGFIVRQFNANLNGVKYTRPAYNLCGTLNKGYTQASCELTVPTAVGKTIRKGSTIEMVIEYDVLPNNISTYYGSSDYLSINSSLMGTSDGIYQQVLGGKINVNASVGTVISSYPVAISAVSGDVVAQFTINGGLGYVPVTVKGLPTFSGYKLQVKSGAEWVDVDQSVNGNDYWQAYRDSNGSYSLTYNVKNTAKLDFNRTNEYRLIYAK